MRLPWVSEQRQQRLNPMGLGSNRHAAHAEGLGTLPLPHQQREAPNLVL